MSCQSFASTLEWFVGFRFLGFAAQYRSVGHLPGTEHWSMRRVVVVVVRRARLLVVVVVAHLEAYRGDGSRDEEGLLRSIEVAVAVCDCCVRLCDECAVAVVVSIELLSLSEERKEEVSW